MKNSSYSNPLTNWIRNKLAPDPLYIGEQKKDGYEINQEAMAALVAGVAISLPLILVVFSALGYLRFRDSISHYYYSAFFGDVFIIMIAAIGTFLIAYKGESSNETKFASVAGIFTYFVALFPTMGVGIQNGDAVGRAFVNINNIGEIPTNSALPQEKIDYAKFLDNPENIAETSFELFSISQFIHGFATAVLFGFLTIFCLFVFTRVRPEHYDYDEDGNADLKKTKKRRNRTYRNTGWLIFICIVLIAFNGIYLKSTSYGQVWADCNVTFWLEVLALLTFGHAWAVKSKFLGFQAYNMEWKD